jgi:hypothetical protein
VRRSSIVSVTAAATVIICGVLIGIITARGSDGVRDEGTAIIPSAHVSATPAFGVTTSEAARLVKSDPKVDEDIRAHLQTCSVSNAYPVDSAYANLTGGSKSDLIINVETCTDDVGVGAYVYQWRNGRYVNVFKNEDLPVLAQVSNGQLKVTHQVYGPLDTASSPSGENITSYKWNGVKFVKISTVYHDYTAAGKKTHG